MLSINFAFLENIIAYYFPLTLLLLCGIYITLNGGFFQLKKFPQSAKLIIKAITVKKEKGAKLTSLQSACTALAATVGTGNIAGVAGAVSLGGAGAVFWMWVSAFLGMAVKYAEITLAICFRQKNKTEYIGGPMYYIKSRLPKGLKFLSVFYAIAGIPACFCTGNITQSNSAILSVSQNIYVRLGFGIIFAALTYIVIFGGSGRIGLVTEKTVPVMSAIYTALAITVIILNIDLLPTAFNMIIKGAFNPKAVTGGVVGTALTSVITGASRGIFSNEAGLGTSAMAHSIAEDANPDTQGLFGIFEVFVDTILICTLTGLTILCSGVKINYGAAASAELVGNALSAELGGISYIALAVMMCFFGFSSVIGWAVYGNICTSFLFGDKGKTVFLFIYPLGCILGAVATVDTAWKISEFFNGIMLCVNIPSILLLSDEFLNVLRGNKNAIQKNRKFAKTVRK